MVSRFRGAMVARLTPDQEVACSSHVGIKSGGMFWCCFQKESYRDKILRTGVEPVTYGFQLSTTVHRSTN